ncbi:hypothetical protein RFI_40055, partial [Reticulomyxa filosa]
AIHNKRWNIARYCIEQDEIIPQTPFEYMIDNKMDKEQYSEMMKFCKWMLRKRTMYPMKQIEYVIDYIKDKLIDEDKGATFLLGMDQKELQKIFDGGWHVMTFLRYRIFLLFEKCVQLKREGKRYIELQKKNTTFEQVYEKGLKELQVQLTTYWDYIIAMRLHYICPDLLDDWSRNMVDRLTPISSKNEYFEMNLVIGHEDHSIYLGLCKTSIHILIRIDNRLMKTIPSDTHLNKIESTRNKDCTLIKPYLNWPYRPAQGNTENCYLRNHNIEYRIRLGDIIYEWFRNREGERYLKLLFYVILQFQSKIYYLNKKYYRKKNFCFNICIVCQSFCVIVVKRISFL